MRYARASRLEAWTLSAALVTRVLHRLLQLDAAFFHVSACGSSIAYNRWCLENVCANLRFYLLYLSLLPGADDCSPLEY